MSSIIHKKAYQEFLNLLRELARQGISTESMLATTNNREIWTELKYTFEETIIPLTDEELEGDIASRWISLQAEIQRSFRLLNTDWLFLMSSRQITTKKAREKAFLARLDRLIEYCQAMLTVI